MADISRLRRPNRLPAPPGPDEASNNLTAPEVAPSALPPSVPAPAEAVTAPAVATGTPRRDGRSLRRTGRTERFSTSVSTAFDRRARAIARKSGLMLVEVLEQILTAYQDHHPAPGGSQCGGRPVPLSTRVTAEFLADLYRLAAADGLLMVEVLERGLDALEPPR